MDEAPSEELTGYVVPIRQCPCDKYHNTLHSCKPVCHTDPMSKHDDDLVPSIPADMESKQMKMAMDIILGPTTNPRDPETIRTEIVGTDGEKTGEFITASVYEQTDGSRCKPNFVEAVMKLSSALQENLRLAELDPKRALIDIAFAKKQVNFETTYWERQVWDQFENSVLQQSSHLTFNKGVVWAYNEWYSKLSRAAVVFLEHTEGKRHLQNSLSNHMADHVQGMRLVLYIMLDENAWAVDGYFRERYKIPEQFILHLDNCEDGPCVCD